MIKTFSIYLICLLTLTCATHAKISTNIEKHKTSENSKLLECGSYNIRGWIKLNQGNAYLVVANDTQSEIQFNIPAKNTAEVLLLADQPVDAKINLTENKKMLLTPRSKKWIQPRIVNFHDELNFKKLVQLKKKGSCLK